MEEKVLKYCDDYSINKKIDSLENTIRVDVGLDGDDAYFFLKDFESFFNIDLLSKLDFESYFHSEHELFKAKGFFKIKEIRGIEKELKISDLLG